MSPIIAVAGGSAGLGRAIIDALKADGQYEPVILGRKSNSKLEDEIGVRILATDYSSIDSIVQFLEENKIDTVISTLNPSNMDPTPEMNLIQAADRSKATRRFIPNVWSGFNYKPEHAKVFPPAAGKLAIQDALKKTSLEYTTIFPGLFLDYFAPNIPTHVTIAPMVVDVKGNAAGIPGSGDYPVNFTHTSDIGRFTVAALGLEKWDTRYLLKGDTKTWNEVVAIAEKAKGVKFDVVYDSIERLEAGQITELPGNKAIYEAFGGEAAKPMVIAMLVRIGIFMVEGLTFFDGGKFLDELFPEIKPLVMKDALPSIS